MKFLGFLKCLLRKIKGTEPLRWYNRYIYCQLRGELFSYLEYGFVADLSVKTRG